MIRITLTFRNDNPDTIFNCLAARLGREPTDAEARDEVRAILNDEKPGHPARDDRAMLSL